MDENQKRSAELSTMLNELIKPSLYLIEGGKITENLIDIFINFWKEEKSKRSYECNARGVPIENCSPNERLAFEVLIRHRYLLNLGCPDLK